MEQGAVAAAATVAAVVVIVLLLLSLSLEELGYLLVAAAVVLGVDGGGVAWGRLRWLRLI